MEVSERRGYSPGSTGLQKLETDLIAALKAIKHEDYKRYQSLSHSLSNLKSYGIDSKTVDRLDEIKDYVREDLERRAARDEVWSRRIDKVAGYTGLGRVVSTSRLIGRSVSGTYRAGRSAANLVYRASSNASSMLARRGLQSTSRTDREDTEDREDRNLLRRQVAALEGLDRSAKKGGSHAGTGGLASGIPGGRLGKLLGLAGRFGLLGLAGIAGWEIGSWIYNKYSEEIQVKLL